MWKLLTGIIREKLYNHLERNGPRTEEQKGCRKGSRGSKNKLLVDKAILEDCQGMLTNMDRLQKGLCHGTKFMDPEMPGDGRGCPECDLYNLQQHGVLEDSIDIRKLLVTTTVYSDHVTLDSSTRKLKLDTD